MTVNRHTNIELRVPKDAPKWPSMEAPPTYQESTELSSVVRCAPVIEETSVLIENSVGETHNQATNSSESADRCCSDRTLFWLFLAMACTLVISVVVGLDSVEKEELRELDREIDLYLNDG